MHSQTNDNTRMDFRNVGVDQFHDEPSLLHQAPSPSAAFVTVTATSTPTSTTPVAEASATMVVTTTKVDGDDDEVNDDAEAPMLVPQKEKPSSLKSSKSFRKGLGSRRVKPTRTPVLCNPWSFLGVLFVIAMVVFPNIPSYAGKISAAFGSSSKLTADSIDHVADIFGLTDSHPTCVKNSVTGSYDGTCKTIMDALTDSHLTTDLIDLMFINLLINLLKQFVLIELIL